MTYQELEEIGQGIFGKSWKRQIADALNIDERRVNDWSKRQSALPEFVETELKPVITQRFEEIKKIFEKYAK